MSDSPQKPGQILPGGHASCLPGTVGLCSLTRSGSVRTACTSTQTPLAPMALEHSLMGHGVGDPGCPTTPSILAAAGTWQKRLAGCLVIFHCDNLAEVQTWSGQSSRDPALVVLLRELFFVAAQSNFTVQLVHVPGKHNVLADTLSHDLMTKFFALAPQVDPLPSVVPSHLVRL